MAGQAGIVDFGDLSSAVQQEVKRYIGDEDPAERVCILFWTQLPLLPSICAMNVVGLAQIVHVMFEQKGSQINIKNSWQIMLDQIDGIQIGNYDRGRRDQAQLFLHFRGRPGSERHEIMFALRSDRDRVTDLIKKRLAERAQAQARPAEAGQDDLLRMLTRLHDEKLISDQEFETARRKILQKLGLV